VTRVAVNGIFLNVEVTGEGPILVLLHGFTGDTTTWEPILDEFSDYRVVRVDLVGHGKSDSPPHLERYSMSHAVEDLTALLHHLHIETFALLGYSMGARVALHLAIAMPERLWALVLESGSPGIPDEAARGERRASDEQLAASIQHDGLEAFVDRWQDQALFGSQASLPTDVRRAQRQQRLGQSPEGLANSLLGMGTGTQDYLLGRMAGLRVPALFITGALDERYSLLAQQMLGALGPHREDGLPYGEVHTLGGAGHTVHLEQPATFAASVADFLKRVRRQRRRRGLPKI